MGADRPCLSYWQPVVCGARTDREGHERVSERCIDHSACGVDCDHGIRGELPVPGYECRTEQRAGSYGNDRVAGLLYLRRRSDDAGKLRGSWCHLLRSRLACERRDRYDHGERNANGCWIVYDDGDSRIAELRSACNEQSGKYDYDGDGCTLQRAADSVAAIA